MLSCVTSATAKGVVQTVYLRLPTLVEVVHHGDRSNQHLDYDFTKGRTHSFHILSNPLITEYKIFLKIMF